MEIESKKMSRSPNVPIIRNSLIKSGKKVQSIINIFQNNSRIINYLNYYHRTMIKPNSTQRSVADVREGERIEKIESLRKVGRVGNIRYDIVEIKIWVKGKREGVFPNLPPRLKTEHPPSSAYP